MNGECKPFAIQELFEAIEEVHFEVSKIVTKFDLPPDWELDYSNEDEEEIDQKARTLSIVFPFAL
jgi:hypothetical protein